MVKLDGLFEGLSGDSPPLVGLLNAVSNRSRSGRKLKYPIAMSRLYDADEIDGFEDDLQVALILNFKGSK